jgi:integrase
VATRHFIPPQTVASFQFIDSQCDDASKRRKMMQQDRTVLQIAATKDCRTSDKRPKEMASLSTEDMRALVDGCLNYLRSDTTTANGYTNHLITVSFVMLLGPRQQVFRQLEIGESFVKEGESYLIKLRSNQTKNGKAVLLQIPSVLTAMFDHYLTTIRPQLLDSRAPDRGIVFMQRGNAPRADFSSITKHVTQSIIGKAVHAHRFRHGVATSFHAHASTQPKLMSDLARAMNHDVSTQQKHYIHDDHLKNLADLQSHWQSILGSPTQSTSSPSIDAPD